MEIKKILITPRSFGKQSVKPFEILEKNDIDYTLNEYGRVYTEEELSKSLRDKDAIIVGVDPITEKVINSAPNLKVISKYGVGLDNIDLECARKKGIRVYNTLGANTQAVADFTFSLILSVSRQLRTVDKKARNKDWSKNIGLDVYGKTLGIIGFGEIGQAVANRARGFSMDILVYDPYYKGNHQTVDLNEVIVKSDFITIHCPLTEENYHLIGKEELDHMKQSAILINTARGGIVDEKALAQALREKIIYGAGLDVFQQEPESSYLFLDLENVILGTHTAASTVDAVNNMGEMSVLNLLGKENENE